MAKRIRGWGRKRSPIAVQEQSLLFGLPSELRERIWFYALTQSSRPLAEPHSFHYRPDHKDHPAEDRIRDLARYDPDQPPVSRMPREQLDECLQAAVDTGPETKSLLRTASELPYWAQLKAPPEKGSDGAGASSSKAQPLKVWVKGLMRHRGRQNAGSSSIPHGLANVMPVVPAGLLARPQPQSHQPLTPPPPQNPGGDRNTYEWVRPGHDGIPYTPGLALLRACRRIYLEASPLLAKAQRYNFWYFRGPPAETNTQVNNFFNTVLPVDCRRYARDIHLFPQMYWLEQSFQAVLGRGAQPAPAWQLPAGDPESHSGSAAPSSSPFHDPWAEPSSSGSDSDSEVSYSDSDDNEDDDRDGEGSSTPSLENPHIDPRRHRTDPGYLRHVRTLRITLGRGDWWYNESNNTASINPFAGDADLGHMVRDMRDQLPDAAATSQRWRRMCPALANHQVRRDRNVPATTRYSAGSGSGWTPSYPRPGGETAVPNTTHAFADSSWALAFRHLPNLDTIVFQMEHAEDKRGELAAIAEWVRKCWWFPAMAFEHEEDEDESGGAGPAAETSEEEKISKRRRRRRREREYKLVFPPPEFRDEYAESFNDAPPPPPPPAEVVAAAVGGSPVGACPSNKGKGKAKAPSAGEEGGEGESQEGLTWCYDRDVAATYSYRGNETQWSHVCAPNRHGPRRGCEGGWCQRKFIMKALGIGPRIYGYSFVFRRVVVDEDER